MKTTALITTVFSIMVVGASFKSSAETTVKVAPPTTCSLKTLTGTYVYSFQGDRGGQPFASSGLLSFNGAGQLTGILTDSDTRQQASTTGTYIVNSDCSGTLTLVTGTKSNIYLSPLGDVFRFVRIAGDDVIASDAQRVSLQLIVKQP